MKPITTKIHGFLDYGTGVLLIAMPWILRLALDTPAALSFLIAGVAALFYSLHTRYELGLIRAIPMHVHLALDAISGVILALSPWLFGFSDTLYLPHAILGVFEIMAALMTKTRTSLG
ncbi:hypothetical protein HYN59_16255 [Flavobacterium album]|uniref:SPW repeat-containing integral membrane domain-containing protein n=1 Tax=Flavobacterium album TaxID=2175091 RepID=A0A2S1R1H3_9FLAO|nr:SPW repeat protein [Flavobacterium album]AWH86563.1 hypothetical protein HYN59_16255 [Flavobacterium album]